MSRQRSIAGWDADFRRDAATSHPHTVLGTVASELEGSRPMSVRIEVDCDRDGCDEYWSSDAVDVAEEAAKCRDERTSAYSAVECLTGMGDWILADGRLYCSPACADPDSRTLDRLHGALEDIADECESQRKDPTGGYELSDFADRIGAIAERATISQ